MTEYPDASVRLCSVSDPLFEIQFYGAVIRSHYIRQDLRVFQSVLQALGDTEIVDAPARVFGTGAEPIRPPGVYSLPVRIKITECIDKSRVQKFLQLLMHFAQKSLWFLYL